MTSYIKLIYDFELKSRNNQGLWLYVCNIISMNMHVFFAN